MDQEQVENWKRALVRFREGKDVFFRRDPDSPLGLEDRRSFSGLKYFEPDPAYRFELELRRLPSLQSLIMGTSKGTRQLFNRMGKFDFAVDGKQMALRAYQSAERVEASLFVPFRDATSGKESYGAARYLDLEVQHDDRYALDFNYAYNPYCAYSEDYVCPLPPQENWLTVPIRAGEKTYHE